ncbi:MAG: aspartate dehydrogenase [Acidimicrobiaceae bacterium]|nr:aspartate dehydrogenase [Acidimicrobiaceae bacterium]
MRDSAAATTSTRLRLVFVGWGAIAQATARLLHERSTPARIVAVATRDPTESRPHLPPEALLLAGPQDLGRLEADVVIEVADRQAVAPWGRAALDAGLDFVVSSVSAFAEAEILEELTELALRNGAQIHIPPGALGGVDALAAATAMRIGTVEHRIIKPPHAWLGTLAEDLCNLRVLTHAEAFFEGTAAEAASQFPKNANSVLTTALAGAGAAATHVTLIADPHTEVNRHEIRADGEFGELAVALSNRPLDQNPRSSAMTALSLVRCIENRRKPLII